MYIFVQGDVNRNYLGYSYDATEFKGIIQEIVNTLDERNAF